MIINGCDLESAKRCTSGHVYKGISRALTWVGKTCPQCLRHLPKCLRKRAELPACLPAFPPFRSKQGSVAVTLCHHLASVSSAFQLDSMQVTSMSSVFGASLGLLKHPAHGLSNFCVLCLISVLMLHPLGFVPLENPAQHQQCGGKRNRSTEHT